MSHEKTNSTVKKAILILHLVFLLPLALIAQQSTKTLTEGNPNEAGISAERLKLLDAHIEKFVQEGHVPGGVFMLARKGKIVYNKSFGYQTLDKKKPYAKSDIFRLASMTKAFTTVSIMQLYERGKLGLDDPIFYYIPAFAKPVVLDKFNEQDSSFTTVPTKKAITIRHLLTHTSGITYGSFNPGKIQAVYEKTGANNFGLSHPKMTTADMANQMAKVPLIFEPGERYMYGLNMEILGRIVEVASGMSLSQYFQKNIFEPLGLKETHFYLPKNLHDRLVPVYTYNDKREMIMASDTDFGPILEYPRGKDNNHYAGGGGMSGSITDYAIFIQTLLNGGEYNGKRILSRKTIDVMTSDQMIVLNRTGKGYSKTPGMTYGLGFALFTEEARAASHKSPGTFEWGGYFNTKFFIDPEEEMIFVGMTQIVPFARPDFWDKMYAIIYGAVE